MTARSTLRGKTAGELSGDVTSSLTARVRPILVRRDPREKEYSMLMVREQAERAWEDGTWERGIQNGGELLMHSRRSPKDPVGPALNLHILLQGGA